MCRSIKPLFNFDPPAGDDDVRAAALQFVRKISGFHKPSHANAEAFSRAVDEIAAASDKLLRSLETKAPRKLASRKVGQPDVSPQVEASVGTEPLGTP